MIWPLVCHNSIWNLSHLGHLRTLVFHHMEYYREFSFFSHLLSQALTLEVRILSLFLYLQQWIYYNFTPKWSVDVAFMQNHTNLCVSLFLFIFYASIYCLFLWMNVQALYQCPSHHCGFFYYIIAAQITSVSWKWHFPPFSIYCANLCINTKFIYMKSFDWFSTCH